MPIIEQRIDGLWLIFATGEEAGPSAALCDAEAFLDHVEILKGAS